LVICEALMAPCLQATGRLGAWKTKEKKWGIFLGAH
jgi:hypothetical protein